MSLWKRFTDALSKKADTQFVYIRLPGRIEPLERGDRFEDPLGALLQKSGLGLVTGGGSSLGPPCENGARFVVSAGIDIETPDLTAVRSLLQKHLLILDTPIGTQIEFTRDGIRLQDTLQPNGWLLEGARTDVHPSFGL